MIAHKLDPADKAVDYKLLDQTIVDSRVMFFQEQILADLVNILESMFRSRCENRYLMPEASSAHKPFPKNGYSTK
jgi:hypothetical protein